ncbi:MAG: TetR/AcrR family transcriptional regulator [Pseudomonadota bacterium]
MEKQRRTPEQTRARVTCDAILTAAAHILELEGPEAFTTNRIAEKAGVSIGSLYQYYRNKEDVLVGLAEREERTLLPEDALQERARLSEESALRLGLRAYINMLPDTPIARSKALETVLAQRGPEGVARETDRRFSGFEAFRTLSPTQRFVISRAVTGVVQSAVRESRSDLHSRAFEDALVTLVRGFLTMPSSQKGRETSGQFRPSDLESGSV